MTAFVLMLAGVAAGDGGVREGAAQRLALTAAGPGASRGCVGE
jgi:hypothetical protein